MKKRVISITVKVGDEVLFIKENASPQDLMAALTLYERDELTVITEFKSYEVSNFNSNQN